CFRECQNQAANFVHKVAVFLAMVIGKKVAPMEGKNPFP
ncbi:hypothetical protein SAI_2382, partial [Streptococcus agalactiae H36B]